jgi:flagellar FliL protein
MSAGPQAVKGKGKGKLVIIIAAAVLVAAGAGGWFSGVIPKLLGRGGERAEHAAAEAPAARAEPVFVDMPEIIANLNAGTRRAAYVKLRAKLELARKEDQRAIETAMPRIIDLFQGYLREMRPEELRGTAGTYRLREELVSRTNIAAAPARVSDVLFIEILVQ